MFTFINLIVIISVSILYYDFGVTKLEYMACIAICLGLQFVIALADLIRSTARIVMSTKHEGC